MTSAALIAGRWIVANGRPQVITGLTGRRSSVPTDDALIAWAYREFGQPISEREAQRVAAILTALEK